MPSEPAPPPEARAARAAPVLDVSWRWLGRTAFRDALALQLATRERVWAGEPGVVLLCEHPPVITLGRSATPANILDARGVDVERIERGGEVTYHGPGQLMIYPVVRIRSVVTFLAGVAGAIAATCAAFGVAGAAWQRDPAGVWLAGQKIAACGIHVARGVSVHGFAFNVATPPEAWRAIRPCGLDVPQISLDAALHASRDAARDQPSELPSGVPRDVPSRVLIDVERVAQEIGPRVVEAVRWGPTV